MNNSAKRNIWLEDAIEEFVRNNPGKDSVDIAAHFKLRADITLESLGQLIKDGKVIRSHLFGSRYEYILITEDEKTQEDDWAQYDIRPCDRYMEECKKRNEEP